VKISRAKIEGFRTLRDVELNFSTDKDRNLTVIRAANETGKTNLYRALGWALFGESSLPKRGSGFRISPLDWKAMEGENTCKISVTVWFEEEENPPSGPETKQYKMLRTTEEALNDTEVGYIRSKNAETVKLWQLTNAGNTPIDDHKSAVERFFPQGLLDIYFLNGDEMLTFISQDLTAATKKTKVQNAIAEVLNLPILDKSAGHIDKIAQQFNASIGQLDLLEGNRDIGKEIATTIADIEKLTAEQKGAEEQIGNLSEDIAKLESALSNALKTGNKEELVKRKADITLRIELINEQEKRSAIRHSNLVEDSTLAVELLWDHGFSRSREILDEMRNKDEIPTQTGPVLEARKEVGICFCGENLDSENPEGAKRIKYIDDLIQSSAEADEQAIVAGDLYVEAKPQGLIVNPDSRESSWSEKYSELVRERTKNKEAGEQAGKELADINLEISKVPDTDIAALRTETASLQTKLDEQKDIKTKTTVQIDALMKKRRELEKERDRALGRDEKALKQKSRLAITEDISTVLKRTQNKLRYDVRHSVSDTMNHLFLTMIGSHDEDAGIIGRAEVTEDFEILAYDSHGYRLTPDIDLNGASRRALTMAFILALCKESGIQAPNIIDTPTGVMTEEVSNEFINQCVGSSSQLILCLQHREILGMEELITKKALPDYVYTLTISKHYPNYLVNDPGTDKISAQRCECTHLEYCDACERKEQQLMNGAAELHSQWISEVQ